MFVRDRDTDGNGIFDEPGGAATERVSVGSNGEEGSGPSGGAASAAITPDGRYVAFNSWASNLVPGDASSQDIFVRDRQTGTTVRIHESVGAPVANGRADEVAISADGQLLAFTSDSSNLAPGDDDGTVDIFVHDRATGVTSMVSASKWYSAGPNISADGRYVAYYAFQSYGQIHKYVHDAVTGTTTQVDLDTAGVGTQGNFSRALSITAAGREVIVSTDASLVPGAGGGVYAIGCNVFQSEGEPDPAVCPPPAPPLSPADQARFAAGAAEFAQVDTIAEGLGPVFNASSCAECHNRPYVGGSGLRTVTRIGASGSGGFDPLVAHGGPVIQVNGIDTGTCTVPGEVVPVEATVVAERDTPALFGVGLIALVPESRILRYADPTDKNHDGITGRPNLVGGLVGRFGRKG